MSITEPRKIDLIGTDEHTGSIILTISDHLDWSDGAYHLHQLQNKINSYIEFIESGQIKIDFPDILLSDEITIEIVSKHEYPKIGKDFLTRVQHIIEHLNVKIIQNTYSK